MGAPYRLQNAVVHRLRIDAYPADARSLYRFQLLRGYRVRSAGFHREFTDMREVEALQLREQHFKLLSGKHRGSSAAEVDGIRNKPQMPRYRGKLPHLLHHSPEVLVQPCRRGIHRMRNKAAITAPRRAERNRHIKTERIFRYTVGERLLNLLDTPRNSKLPGAYKQRLKSLRVGELRQHLDRAHSGEYPPGEVAPSILAKRLVEQYAQLPLLLLFGHVAGNAAAHAESFSFAPQIHGKLRAAGVFHLFRKAEIALCVRLVGGELYSRLVYKVAEQPLNLVLKSVIAENKCHFISSVLLCKVRKNTPLQIPGTSPGAKRLFPQP